MTTKKVCGIRTKGKDRKYSKIMYLLCITVSANNSNVYNDNIFTVVESV